MWTTIAKFFGVDTLVVYLVAGLIAAGALGIAYWWITDSAYDRGAADMKVKWVESANRWKAYTEKLDASYRAKERSLQASADALRNEKDQNDARNRADVDRIAGELRRERNRRPAGLVPSTPTATSAGRPGTCTLRDVYADDGEWLIGLAGAADRANNALIQCRALYNRARETLSGARP